MADTTGMEMAYAAWKAELAAHPSADLPKPQLTGHFKHEQLFWIARSLPFCSVDNASYLKWEVEFGSTDPSSVKLWTLLKMSKSWRDSFGCKVESEKESLIGGSVWGN